MLINIISINLTIKFICDLIFYYYYNILLLLIIEKKLGICEISIKYFN